MNGQGNWTGEDAGEVEISIDINVIAQALLNNPAFIKKLAIAMRTPQTQDVRRMGNLYGTTAQRPATPPQTKRRLT